MPRITKPLTKTEIERAKPKDKEYSLADCGGLSLRIKPNGSKLWLFNYYHPITQKRTNAGLGSYPAISLADARAKREEYRALLAQSVDPQEYAKEQAQMKRDEDGKTFLHVALLWKEKRSKEVEALTMAKNWARLEKYIFPALGEIAIDKITSPLLINAVKPLNEQGYNDTLHRLLNLANQILNYAVTLGIIPYNLCAKAADAYHKQPQRNHPAIKPEQLP